VKCFCDSSKSIGTQMPIRDMYCGPALVQQGGVAAPIMLNAFLGEVLPAITFKRNPNRGQREVNGVAANLVLKDVRNTEFNQSLLGHRFNVCPVTAAALLAEGARFKAITHPEQSRATVTTAALALGGPISFHGKWLTTESTDQVDAMRCLPAFTRAEMSHGLAREIDWEHLSTCFAGGLGMTGSDATFDRAIIELVRLGDADVEKLSAFRARLGYPVLDTGAGAEYPVGARAWDEWLVAALTNNGLADWVVPTP